MKKIVILLATLSVTACAAKHQEPPKPIGMPNPASVYCEQIGGKSVLVNTDTGVTGNCVLPSGKVVEEWSLYRQAHENK
ncbi:hemolysin [Izhakiella australiensis]|uniref:Hemolysin n=2 Tax=Izhakiella australiensis TaxID=1926881 RepID=A0A1S8YRP5_9GAMM|nr:hemolysin [Izhakiella australiensis]